MSASTQEPIQSWLVGSSPECDITVAQPSISGRHCRLSQYPDGFVLEDLGSTNGTYVNGHKLSAGAPVYVSPSDVTTLGLKIPIPWPAAANGGSSRRQDARSANATDSRVITIGRDPESDVQLDYPMISWQHARVTRTSHGAQIEDLGSTNGTSLNRVDNRITRAELLPTDDIYLGSYKIPASRVLSGKHITRGESAFELVNFRGDRMVLGRDPASDYPLDYPMISWQHAQLLRTPQGIVAEDLGSRNGTYVNGQRISGKVPVKPGDEVGLGSFRFQILEGGSLAKRQYNGNVTIEVAGVAVNAPNGKPLLEPVSLTVFPSEIVALMGPAGAGKTTFLKALNGYTPPAAGQVLFNGADLYKFYDRFRQQMGYVPQDDIVHSQLKVREALYFSAKLRTDLTDAEIEKRIDNVLESLGIPDKKNDIIGSPERKVLSGGQRKRVNIAMELINDTPVIFLDEPTSGLSSYDAEGVIKLLKNLSTQGKTIITTIHQPSLDIFREFDNLIMLARDKGGIGSLAYFGPAFPDSIEFFDQEGVRAVRSQPGKELNPEMLLTGLTKRKAPEWANAYSQGSLKSQFVTERSGKIPSTPSQTSASAVRGFGFGQWITLVRRNFILKMRDKVQSTILLVQAPLFAILVGGVFLHLREPAGNLAPDKLAAEWQKLGGEIVGIEFLMVIAAIWFGCNNVARDIVGEWTVYQRERMVSLKLPSYLFSKLTIAAGLSLVQCFTLLLIVTLMCQLKANFFEMLGILYLASMVGSAIGLCISAMSETTEAAIAMLPLVLLPIVALGGGIRPIKDIKPPVQQIVNVVPSRWAFEAAFLKEARLEHDESETSPRKYTGTQRPNLADNQFDPAKAHSEQTVFAVLFGMFIVLIGAVLGILRKRDIQ